MRSLACLALALTSGCASSLPSIRDSGGEVRWHRVVSPHFVVEGTADADALESTAVELEVMHHAFAQVPYLGRRPPAVRPVVVVFAEDREYEHFFLPDSGGMFVPASPLGPLIALRPGRGAFSVETVKHELSHLFLEQFLPAAPTWLDEGLAELMSSAEYDRRGHRVLFGEFTPTLLRNATEAVKPRRSDGVLEAWPHDGLNAAYYGAAWLLVHLLIDADPRTLANLEVRLSQGLPWKEAWFEQVTWPLAEVQPRIAAYLKRERFGVWSVPAVAPPSAQLSREAVTEADGLALRAILRLNTMVHRDRDAAVTAAQRDLAAARALEPGNPRVRRIEQRMPLVF